MCRTISVRGAGRGGRLAGRAAGAGAGIAVAVSCLVPAGAVAFVPGGSWGMAQQVPGLAALGPSGIVSVSCASAGNCSAGGFLEGGSGQEAFVVSQVNGHWGKGEEVPGTVALDTGRQGRVDSVSCASPGNAAPAGPPAIPPAGLRRQPEERHLGQGPENPRPGGPHEGQVRRDHLGVVRSAGRLQRRRDYQRHGFHGFVVSQNNGRWGKVLPVPPRMSEIDSLSCASPGNCSAGGGAATLPLTARRTAPGAKPRKSPAWRPSTRAAIRSSARCRAPRRATATQADGLTISEPPLSGTTWSARRTAPGAG